MDHHMISSDSGKMFYENRINNYENECLANITTCFGLLMLYQPSYTHLTPPEIRKD